MEDKTESILEREIDQKSDDWMSEEIYGREVEVHRREK